MEFHMVEHSRDSGTDNRILDQHLYHDYHMLIECYFGGYGWCLYVSSNKGWQNIEFVDLCYVVGDDKLLSVWCTLL